VQVRLAEPVFVALEPPQRRAAVDALAALLAPHVDAPAPPANRPARRIAGVDPREGAAQIERVREA